VTVVVGTKGTNIKHDYPTNVRVYPEESGLPIETVFMCFQVRSIDKGRFPTEASGQISDAKMLEIEATVRYCLGL
jgi:mRNA interferase MazF